MTISYSDFKNLTELEQKDTLEKLREEIGVSELIKIWGISRSKIYKMIHDLGLSVSSKGRKPKTKVNDSKDKKKPGPKPKNQDEIENLRNQETTSIQTPSFSVSLTAQGSFQTVSEKLQFLFQQNIVPNTNVRVTISIEEI